jgi:hypothetical protein
MSAVLAQPTGLVHYSPQYAAEIMALAREMHAESVMRDIPLAEEKLREQFAMASVHPHIYLRLWLHDGLVAGGLYGILSQPYWTYELVACDRAWFVTLGRRGSIAAVRVLDDFEAWAKALGVRYIMPGQTTGVRMEETRRLFESRGYRVRGFNFIKEV